MAASRYRNFLRLCEEWPVDKTKAGRDLGTFIRDKVALTFRHGETTKINENECDKMYDNLHLLNTNFYKNKYARSGENSVGACGIPVEQCQAVISTEGLEIAKRQDSTLMERLKGKS